jgi:phosphate transport system substrate-binding protein
MSETKKNERMARGRRYRLARLKHDDHAVSPVVATLILILVAVAAAAALYLWLVAWQGGVTKGIGSPTAQSTLSIGGSTTLYPGDVLAVQWFEQNNSNVVINNVQGGSGAGILAVCGGSIDIAASSRALAPTDIAACPALASATQTKIGLSAVVVTLATTNAQGFTADSANSGWAQAVLASIYQVNGGGAGLITTPLVNPGPGTTPAVFGLAAGAPSAACTGGVPGIAGKCYAWADIPHNWGSAACNSAGTAACTYGASAAEIHIYGRADNGGTSETFVTKLLGAKCGTDNQLQSCGVSASASGGAFVTGNQGVGAAVAADPLGLGYNDFGNIGSIAGVASFSYQNASQTAPVVPTLTTIKTAAGGIPAPYTTGYGGWRQLEYVTMGVPTGEALRFIQFVTGPSVDQTICAIEGWISTYS